MEKPVPQLIEESAFLTKYNINPDAYAQTGLRWATLDAIFDDYVKFSQSLESTASTVADHIRQAPGVHSLRYRVKDPEHLVEKIIRWRIEQSNLVITLDNYREKIRDLVGVRVLHLLKEHWGDIHEFIMSTWTTMEQPKANIREGDSKEWQNLLNDNGCQVILHKRNYRSVHYIITGDDAIPVEIQVRTIFEEGWSEIDHQFRYPYDTENQLLKALSYILNRYAGAADEMGSYMADLKQQLQEHQKTLQDAEQTRKNSELALKAAIEELQLGYEEKANLQQKVDELVSQVSLISIDLENAKKKQRATARAAFSGWGR